MITKDGKPIGEVPQKKDPYWWMHPAYRGEQALDMATLDAMPQGGYQWVAYSDESATKPDDGSAMQRADGYFADFAQLLYKMSGFRPYPVCTTLGLRLARPRITVHQHLLASNCRI